MKILYKDNDIIVVFKEAGIAVQSSRIGTKDLISELKNTIAESGSGAPYLGMVHRLDQPVEGIMVFALNKKSAGELSKEVGGNGMEKIYTALVTSDVEPSKSECRLVDYLLQDRKSNSSLIVTEEVKGSKKAELLYSATGRYKSGGYILKVKLLTGRHHQIRVQLSGHGMPIIGDRKYGGEAASQLMLCASHLSFLHPLSGRKMEFDITPSFLS